MNPLSGYVACKSVVVTHTDDGTQTNYQMKLTIVKGDGSDSAGKTYLDNKALNWPYDIRFTKTDGTTLLDFWREESDATDGTWWIEVDSIPDPTNTTIYLHVGDADAVDASDGEATFILFDDFDDSSLDTDKWTSATGISEGAGTVVLTGGASSTNLMSKNKVSTSHSAMRSRLKTGHNNSGSYYENYCSHLDGGYQSSFLFCHVDPVVRNRCYTANNAAANLQYDSLITGDAADTWMVCDICRNGSTSAIFRIDDGNEHINSNANCVYSADGYIVYGAYLSGASGEVDWSLVRNFTINEPTWGAWGDWETGATPKTNAMPAVLALLMN